MNGAAAMEFWDLYNDKREKTGRIHERGKALPEGYYHLCVSVWLVNRKGEFLLSQRHPDKEYPLCWECTGGSVLAGESSLDGALREVKEELGITLAPEKGKILFQTRRDQSQDYYDACHLRELFSIAFCCPILASIYNQCSHISADSLIY